MEQIIIAAAVGLGVYILGVFLLPADLRNDNRGYTRSVLARLYKETEVSEQKTSSVAASILKDYMADANTLARCFLKLPGGRAAYPLLLKSGMGEKADQFFAGLVVVFFLLLAGLGFVMRSRPILVLPLAIALTYFLAWKFLKSRVQKRNGAFINQFPDALDMIVRSVKSGYPLNTAIQMVAENMPAPIGLEFKHIIDEVTYGRSLLDALRRLVERIDEPDIRFFVVVLSVQQEAGGNLSEVLSNLAGVIRKRKHLRLKIRALTSEGRTTAWVLGSMPIVMLGVMAVGIPGHLDPLFYTEKGNHVLMIAAGFLVTGVTVVRMMIKVKI